jgi:hypothetical protein
MSGGFSHGWQDTEIQQGIPDPRSVQFRNQFHATG